MPANPWDTLDEAQARKNEVVLDKLAVGPGTEYLDVGFGWGAALRHARARGAVVSGLNPVGEQYRYVSSSFKGGGPRLFNVDWREHAVDGSYEAISSVGMYEHVGRSNSRAYFQFIAEALRPDGGRYLHHSIVRREGHTKKFRPNSFVDRYIFPNGQLQALSDIYSDAELVGLRPIGMEAFGESYSWTLRRWLENLESNIDQMTTLVGAERVRAWQLYLSGAAAKFDSGVIDVVQILMARR